MTPPFTPVRSMRALHGASLFTLIFSQLQVATCRYASTTVEGVALRPRFAWQWRMSGVRNHRPRAWVGFVLRISEREAAAEQLSDYKHHQRRLGRRLRGALGEGGASHLGHIALASGWSRQLRFAWSWAVGPRMLLCSVRMCGARVYYPYSSHLCMRFFSFACACACPHTFTKGG